MYQRFTIKLKKTRHNNTVQNFNKIPHKKIVIFFRWAAYEIRHRSTEKLFSTSPCLWWPRTLLWPHRSPLRLRCCIDDRGWRNSGWERRKTRWVNTFLNYFYLSLISECGISYTTALIYHYSSIYSFHSPPHHTNILPHSHASNHTTTLTHTLTHSHFHSHTLTLSLPLPHTLLHRNHCIIQ